MRKILRTILYRLKVITLCYRAEDATLYYPLDAAKAWVERVIYCHHNARVLADMEWRLGCVLNHCTNGMSKAYYPVEAMKAEIDQFISDRVNEEVSEYLYTYLRGECFAIADAPKNRRILLHYPAQGGHPESRAPFPDMWVSGQWVRLPQGSGWASPFGFIGEPDSWLELPRSGAST